MKVTEINTEIIKNSYDFKEIKLEWFNQTKHKNVFKVFADGNTYVLRIFSESRTIDQVERDILILEFLEQNNFPAQRLIITTEGKFSINIDHRQALLLSYVEGQHPDLNAQTMAKIGELMAKLHLLGESIHYPYQANWNVENEKKVLEKELKRKDIQNLPDPEGIIPQIKQEFDKLPNLQNLPQTIIHTDMHGNNILEKDGEFILIDWDDAGVAAAIIDIGEVLSQVCIRFEDEEKFEGITFREDLAKPFLESYQKIRKLTQDEKDNLINAMKFAALSYSIQYWVPAIAIGDWKRFKLEKEHGKNLLVNVLN